MNKKVKILNEIKLIAFVAIIGTVAGVVFWLFLWMTNTLTELIWQKIPGVTGNIPYYALIVCTLGGLIIGILRKLLGDYPQGMTEVIGTVKKTGTYPYKKILSIIVLAVLPLIIGSSVGPEAGMIGIIVALCCWAGDNIRFAKKSTINYSKVGSAVTLSVLFHSPLFGIFHAEENEEEDDDTSLTKTSKFMIYAISTASGIGVYSLLSNSICEVSEGFPSFEAALPTGYDYLAMFLYIACGIALGFFFMKSELIFERIAEKIPPIVGELIAGIVLGAVACFLPVIQFSGETQMGVLISDYAKYAPSAMIGIALLKILITNMCIQLGLKGGHIFPLMFSAVCLGYGISLMIFPGSSAHAVFAAAIVTAATLGVSMKKPIAVTMLLFLCFPIRMFFWIFLSAAVSTFISKKTSD
ncbi:MAG: chloride channel protein [Eubacteriales bacterium]|nr:chloride channel protein [Eubacteriales bacterium]